MLVLDHTEVEPYMKGRFSLYCKIMQNVKMV